MDRERGFPPPTLSMVEECVLLVRMLAGKMREVSAMSTYSSRSFVVLRGLFVCYLEI